MSLTVLRKTKPAQTLRDKFLAENDLIDFSKIWRGTLLDQGHNEVESLEKVFCRWQTENSI
jgi:hypothetical protein